MTMRNELSENPAGGGPFGGLADGSFVACVRRQLESSGERRSFTYLRESGRQLVEEVTTFGEFDRSAREIAAWLGTRSSAERPVLLLFEPGSQFTRAFLGCLYAGSIAVPAPLPHDERSMRRLAGIIRDTDSDLVLTTENLGDPIATGIAALGLDRQIQCVPIDGSPLGDADSWTCPASDDEAVAFLQYTSGTTGSPKGVAVTHGNIRHNVRAIAQAISVHAESVFVGWIPHFHDMGLISQLAALVSGGNFVTMSPLTFLKQPARFLTAISDYRATVSAAPNFAYDLIARRVTPEQIAGLDLSTWAVAVNSAEPVRRRTVERITDLLAPAGFPSSAMRPAYGLAEVTVMATISDGVQRYLEADAAALEQNRFLPATGAAITLVGSGAPARGIDVQIVDPESRKQLPEDQVGEIWLSGGSVAAGYHNRPAETAEAFRAYRSDGAGPFLRTGDLGLLHGGQLYVTGRRKDLLIVNGRNLHPQDIEDFVQQVHPALTGLRGAAFAVDANDAARLVLIQAVNPSLLGAVGIGELASTVKRSIARGFELPAPDVVLVGRAGIHLTTSGKVQRASMRAAFMADELTDIVHGTGALS